MIGIVVIAHGTLAGGLKSAVSLLAGEPEAFSTVELHPGDAPEEFKARVEDAVQSVDSGDGVLVLVDIFGGTPSNTISQLIACGDSNIQAIAGANLPMVIQATFMREQMPLSDLAGQVMQAGQEALVDIGAILAQAAERDDEEEF